VAALQENIFRLDVSVHDAAPVGIIEGVGYVARDADGIVDRERPLACEPVAERLPVHEGHREVEEPVRLAGVVKRDDVRMGEPRRDLNLAKESAGA